MPHYVNHYFGEAIQLQIHIADQLSSRISEVSDALVETLTQGGKIFLISDASMSPICQHLADTRLLRRELPSLPIIHLPTSTAMALLKSLAQPSDILIIVQTTSEMGTLPQILQIARDQRLSVIALTGQTSYQLNGHLHPEDLEITLPTQTIAHLQSLHWMILHCLCQQIDHKLFGALPTDPL